MLRVDAFASDVDVEDPAAAFDQRRSGVESLFDPGSQTDRPGPVVSSPAVGNGDVHQEDLVTTMRTL
jgi:hypothetical protein